LGKADQDRASVGTNGLQARPGNWTLRANDRGRLLDFLGFKPNAAALERMDPRHWRIENGSHYVRDTAFAEDASRIRKNPDIAARLRSFAYNLIRAAGGSNIRNARWRAALDLNLILQLPRLH
jgi:predicted transposase YbfD/YdcC